MLQEFLAAVETIINPVSYRENKKFMESLNVDYSRVQHVRLMNRLQEKGLEKISFQQTLVFDEIVGGDIVTAAQNYLNVWNDMDVNAPFLYVTNKARHEKDFVVKANSMATRLNPHMMPGYRFNPN